MKLPDVEKPDMKLAIWCKQTYEKFLDSQPKIISTDEKIILKTDVGNSRRLLQKYGDNLKYCYPWKTWLVWNGKCWQKDDVGAVTYMAKETIKQIYIDGEKEKDLETRKAMVVYAHKSEARGKINAMVEMAQSEEGVPVLPEQLDPDPWLLCVQNGTIDLRTMQLQLHNRTDNITKISPVVHDPDAKCPVWLKYLDTVFSSDQDLISYIQKAAGYSLTGDTSEECLFILFGTGSNGKSKFIETLAYVLGDLGTKTNINTVLEMKNESSISNDVARLKGMRYVYASEPESGKRLAEGKLKDMTGREKITARFLHAEYFDFKPEFKLWIGTNHKPIIRGVDHGIWRRIKFIPFEVTISDEDQDKNLDIKLVAEAPGILNWLLEGCQKWQQEGLDTPDSVKTATTEYRYEMDALGDFLSSCCEIDKTAISPHKLLYLAYSVWAESTKQRTMGQKTFTQSLLERGFGKRRNKLGVSFTGIRVNDELLKIIAKIESYEDRNVGFGVGCRLVTHFLGCSHVNFTYDNTPKYPTPPYIPTPTSPPVHDHTLVTRHNTDNTPYTTLHHPTPVYNSELYNKNIYNIVNSKKNNNGNNGDIINSVNIYKIITEHLKNTYNSYKKPESDISCRILKNSIKLSLLTNFDFDEVHDEMLDTFITDYFKARGWE